MMDSADDLSMSVGRVEAFSDGVFSVAVTLLVLNLARPTTSDSDPVSSLISFLLNQWPSYLSYLVTFLTLGSVWVSHHQMLKYFRRVDEPVQILNLVFLMFIVVTPFTTGVLAQYLLQPDKLRVAAIIYGGSWSINGICLIGMWRYSRSHGLLKANVTPVLIQRMARSLATGTTVGALGTVISLFVPLLGVILYVLIAAVYVVAPLVQLFRRPAKGTSSP